MNETMLRSRLKQAEEIIRQLNSINMTTHLYLDVLLSRTNNEAVITDAEIRASAKRLSEGWQVAADPKPGVETRLFTVMPRAPEGANGAKPPSLVKL